MLKKILLILYVAIISVLLLACSSTQKDIMPNNANIALQSNTKRTEESKPNNSNSDYKISKAMYTSNGINISYPQISNINDSIKQKIINELIKNEAIAILNYYKEDLKKLSLEINYNIKQKGAYLLSIEYTGSGYVEDGAYPSNIIYTTNIDIRNGNKITLGNIIKIDKYFINKLKNGKYRPFDKELNVQNEVKSEINNYTDEELIKYLGQADDISSKNELSIFSYLTNDSLGVSISVPHAIGDHAEFEVKYKDIIDNINSKNQIWKNFQLTLLR